MTGHPPAASPAMTPLTDTDPLPRACACAWQRGGHGPPPPSTPGTGPQGHPPSPRGAWHAAGHGPPPQAPGHRPPPQAGGWHGGASGPPPPGGSAPSAPRRGPLWFALAAAAAAVALVAGLVTWLLFDGSEPQDAAAEDEEAVGLFRVGIVTPSEDEPALYEAMYAGIELAWQDIDDAGGVLGSPLPPLLHASEMPQTESADDIAQSLLSQNAQVALGPFWDASAIDTLTEAETVVCYGETVDGAFRQGTGFDFRLSSASLYARAVAETLAEEGWETVSLIHRDIDGTEGTARSIARFFDRHDLELVHEDSYVPHDVDAEAVVEGIVDADSDGLLINATGDETAEVLAGLVDAGWDGERMFALNGLQQPEYGRLVDPGDPGVLEGLRGVADAPPELMDRARAHDPAALSYLGTAEFYDCTVITALAAEAAGTVNSADIAAEMIGVTRDGEPCSSFEECAALLRDGQDIDYQGFTGPVEFNEDGDVTVADIPMFEFTSNGAILPLSAHRVAHD